jgi:hypothetical protein
VPHLGGDSVEHLDRRRRALGHQRRHPVQRGLFLGGASLWRTRPSWWIRSAPRR